MCLLLGTRLPIVFGIPLNQKEGGSLACLAVSKRIGLVHKSLTACQMKGIWNEKHPKILFYIVTLGIISKTLYGPFMKEGTSPKLTDLDHF